jgi:hypothetical protein
MVDVEFLLFAKLLKGIDISMKALLFLIPQLASSLFLPASLPVAMLSVVTIWIG